jgi:hypothetical protein
MTSTVLRRHEPAIPGLAIPEHDRIECSNYTGTNPGTLVFKQGGAAGTVVATLTLTYDGNGNLTTVTKS